MRSITTVSLTDKKIFEEIVDKVRAEDEEGDISAESLTKAKNLVSSLRAKIEATRFDNLAAKSRSLQVCQNLGRAGSDARKT